MGNHDFDDGLVHSHHWAREPFTRTQRRHVEAESLPEDRYDDGLVHDHGWARGTSTGH
jgi:hypothetical protein